MLAEQKAKATPNMAATPNLIWAQRREKVFVTFECLDSKDVKVTFADGLLSLDATSKDGKVFKLENLPLWTEIEPEESKWFRSGRYAPPACPDGAPTPSRALRARQVSLRGLSERRTHTHTRARTCSHAEAHAGTHRHRTRVLAYMPRTPSRLTD